MLDVLLTVKEALNQVGAPDVRLTVKEALNRVRAPARCTANSERGSQSGPRALTI